MVDHPDPGAQKPAPPAQIPCGRSLALLRLRTQRRRGRGTGVRVECRGQERRRHREDPPFCEASRPRILTGGGRAARFPLAGTQATPANIPADYYLVNSLPGLSSVDSQPLHSFIHATDTIQGPQRPQPCPGSRGTPSPERGQSCTQTP